MKERHDKSIKILAALERAKNAVKNHVISLDTYKSSKVSVSPLLLFATYKENENTPSLIDVIKARRDTSKKKNEPSKGFEQMKHIFPEFRVFNNPISPRKHFSS